MNSHYKESKTDYNIGIFYLVASPNSLNLFGLPQIKALRVSGFKVHAICGLGTIDPRLRIECESISIVKYLNRGFSLINDVISILLITRLALKTKPKIFIYSTPKAAMIGSVVSRLLNVEIRIYQIWGSRWQNLKGIKGFLVKNADKLTIKLSTHVTAVSKSVAQFYNQSLSAMQLTVLSKGSTVGIDTQIFKITLRGNNKSLVTKLGYAGRVSNDKGISDLFDLFARLSAHIPDIHLQIIGDLDLEDKIPEKLIIDLKSNPRIEWINSLSQVDLAEQMRNWDLQIFLSKREGLGNVILEAGACGVPTYCWDIIGTKDAIPDFAQDFLIPYGDMELLERSVRNYLCSPLEQSKKLKLAEWYLDNFEQKKVLSEFVGFINANLKAYYDSK